jgi:hypothetical protein
MSSYGTVFVIDVPEEVEVSVPDEVRESLENGYRAVAADGRRRIVASVNAVGLVDTILDMVRTAGEGRVAIAEDNDEFGARWVVAGATAGTVEIAHRRYVLNADPADPDEVEGALADLGTDPRRSDLAGPAAAEAAARLFAVPVEPMITAEAESAESWQELGVVGGPFPWWTALELRWPEEGVGETLVW